MALDIQKAVHNDAEKLAAILKQGAELKTKHGDMVWAWRDFSVETLDKWIGESDMFSVRIGNEIVATFMLTDDDNATWGEQSPDAFYIHKLAVSSLFHGKGYGAEILEWAMSYTAANDRHFLRLDVPKNNPKLRSYYEQQGFYWVRDQSISMPYGIYHASLYERQP